MPVSFLILIIYTVFVLFLLVTLVTPARKKQTIKTNCGISVVIPFRNEETRLKSLIASIKCQDYTGPVEIVFVNDESSDNSVSIINTQKKECPFELVLINSVYNPENKITSKQQALDLGISCAKHNWIALTDADMRLEPDFLSSLINSSNVNTALVFGHTSIITEKFLLQKIQAFQLEFLFAIAYTFHLADITGSCMGNNLLISRSAYMESGGQKAIGYNIAEDRALYSLFRRQKKQINSVEPFKTTAYTYPEKKTGGFIEQMRRWAQGGFHPRSSLLPVGILFSFQNILFIPAISGLLPQALSTIVFLNFILTWSLVAVSFWKIHSPQKWLYFPVYYLFLLIQTVLLSFFIISGKRIEWKGRKI